MLTSLQDCFTLSNGVKIPCVGFGTFRTPDDESGAAAVEYALKCGYRHIDSAEVYANESAVAEGIRRSGLDRKDVFLTGKVWNNHQGYESTLTSVADSLKRLKMDYFDLLLIHWPVSSGHQQDWAELNRQTWRAMEKLYADGAVRALGVSNFMDYHLEPLLEFASVAPMVNQIELHPACPQKKIVEFCKAHNILPEAWAPLQRGGVFSNPAFVAMGEKYGKTAGQIALRWLLQNGICPLPKSVTPARIDENADLFDFTLTESDLAQLDADGVSPTDNYHRDPHTTAF